MASLKYGIYLEPHSQLSDLNDEQQAIAKSVFKDKNPLEVILAPEGSSARHGVQIAAYALSSTGGAYEKQNVTLPGNCFVTVTTPAGEMNMGWAFPFDAQGHATTSGPSWHKGQSWQAGPDFPIVGLNSYCPFVQVEVGGPYNPRPFNLVDTTTVPNFGAGISSPAPGTAYVWTIAVNQGGALVTVYNDNDCSDNHGDLSFILTVYSSPPP
jgi:hypothetical protein